MRITLILLLIGSTLFARTQEPDLPKIQGTVGIEGQTILTWAGKPLQIAPIPDDSPVLIRIASITPAEEDQITYDLRWIAMLPGDHDLRPLLHFGVDDPAQGLPPLIISVGSLLDSDHEGALTRIPGPLSPILGFPWWVPWVVAGSWLLLPLFLLTLIRWLKKPPEPEPEPQPKPTLAQLLRPLVVAALAGELDVDRKAHLERILLAHWREDLDLGSFRHAEGIQKLRAHPDAGILLVTVEEWLHSGRTEAVSQEQLEQLLAPYATVVSDPVEEGS